MTDGTQLVLQNGVLLSMYSARLLSMADCFADHARLICDRTLNNQKIYHNALSHPNDPIAFAHALTGVYATDPQYGDKLVSIMESRGLLESFRFATPKPA